MKNPERPGMSANLPHRDISTAQQLNNVLSIVQALYPAILNSWREEMDERKPQVSEARIAAENTFMKACQRLEVILSDDSRWGTEFQKSLEAKYNEAFEKNREFLDAQTSAAKEITTPHFRFKPRIVQLPDGSWSAFLGNPGKPQTFLAGVGDSPQDALEAFDELFLTGKSPQIVNWMRLREAALDAGLEPPDEPEQENPPINEQ